MLETLTAAVLSRIMAHANVQRATVTISKPNAIPDTQVQVQMSTERSSPDK